MAAIAAMSLSLGSLGNGCKPSIVVLVELRCKPLLFMCQPVTDCMADETKQFS